MRLRIRKRFLRCIYNRVYHEILAFQTTYETAWQHWIRKISLFFKSQWEKERIRQYSQARLELIFKNSKKIQRKKKPNSTPRHDLSCGALASKFPFVTYQTCNVFRAFRAMTLTFQYVVSNTALARVNTSITCRGPPSHYQPFKCLLSVFKINLRQAWLDSPDGSVVKLPEKAFSTWERSRFPDHSN